ncbi:MAG: HAD-IA family hydrolase [Acidobacteriota bacterium]|nr:HAD-IA family hydrolase [Acidobacteriota bacterium]MDW3228691.1 HAD-IA family hydrolase [Acidobacteriota bacterium]MDY0232352.1 HAD-IA family hydrolase [Candidatus Saccharicenans sp.]
MTIRLAIFDLDGTIVENSYDWAAIRKELGLESGSILAYLESLPEPQRSEKYAQLEKHEEIQTEKAVLKEGIKEFLEWLSATGIKKALVTNNNQKNARLLLDKFNLNFDLVLTRESGLHKPSGAPFQKVMKFFKVAPEETVVIGDTQYDILAAKNAALSQIYILESQMTPENLKGAVVVASYEEIKARIKKLISKDKDKDNLL